MSSTNMIKINKTNKGKNKRASVALKLRLIAEVKKHDIIWQNIKDKKNKDKDLLEDAWNRVQKAFVTKDAGYYEKQWKLLIHSYRQHVNANISMKLELTEAMAFMKPQLHKSRTGLNENDSMDSGLDKREKKLPEATQDEMRKSSAREEAPSARTVSHAILDVLFDLLPANASTQVCDELLKVLLQSKPNLKTDILEHGLNETNILNPDWSGFAIPSEVCQEIYKRGLQEKLQKTPKAGSKKH